jgi:hypothetical protein
MTRRIPIAIVALVLLGCAGEPGTGQGWVSQPASETSAPVDHQHHSGSPSVAAAPADGSSPAVEASTEETLFLRTLRSDGSAGLIRVSPSGRELPVSLPSGLLDRQKAVVYTATPGSGSGTRVESVDLRTGVTLAGIDIAGRFQFPGIVSGGAPTGLSGDGSTIVLEETTGSGPYDRPSTRFALLDTGLRTPPGIAEAGGNFTFDAVSRDASVLYLVEHLPAVKPTDYQVRAYDVGRGLRDGVIVDKRVGQLLMQGQALAQVATEDGSWVYTAYLNLETGPFIHALATENGFAACLFLSAPAAPAEAARNWRLSLDRANQALFAVNASLGVVARVEIGAADIDRTAAFAHTGATSFEEGTPGSVELARTGVSPDGSTAMVATESGLVELDANGLSARRVLLPGRSFTAVAWSATGRELYAVSAGRLLQLDAKEGRMLRELSFESPVTDLAWVQSPR